MKIRNYPPHFCIILILFCTIYIFSFPVNAQKNKDIIAVLDTSTFKGKPLLNNTIRLQKFFDPFRENTEKVNANQETVLDLPANYFNYLSEMLEQADLKGKPLNNKLKNIIGRKGKEVSSNNTIPIGVFNVESLLLTEEQLSANQDAKKKNLKADSKDYEIIEFIAAGLLQSEAFQGNLSFEIDPSIMISNLNNSIKSISIDFNEGKGFQDYEWKQQTIAHQFTKAGDILIKIKLSTKKGTYITNCPIKIHFLQRPVPSYIGNVSSPSVRSGRIAAGVAGGEYAIFMGCDGILDKPIIIAEGFDAGNNVGIDNLVSYYRADLQIFTNNGYDLVFVNYNDGRDFIENNAEVLKRVIQDINSKKVGHAEINKLSIIGVSMSGLIGRWALKQMENAGQNHEVARLICLDTPHKGANSSPGVSYVAADFANRGIISGLIEAFLYAIVPELSSINSPAAQEQLLFQNTSLTSHVYLSLFQNALQNLGNGGYPSQCKNIAFVNGALNGNQNRRPNGDLINQGDKIWDTDFYLPNACVDRIDCWTNRVNQNTEVYNEDAFGIPILCNIQFSSRSVNLPFNLDRLAGGFNSGVSNQIFQNTAVFPRFSLVPTFSSLDYRGSLNTDADYNINITDWLDGNRQVRTDRQNLTPFRAIYGNNENNEHSYFTGEGDVLQALATNEFGINPVNFFSCQGCTAGSGGLAGTYFDNLNLTNNGNTRTNTTAINFSSNEGLPVPPNGAFSTSNISARWEGSVQAPVTGNYTFNIRTDDGVRIWFDGDRKWNDWGNYPPKDHPFQITLNAGERKNIRIEWYQGSGGYEAKFFWSLNGVSAIVPACYLFPTPAPTSTGCNFAVTASANPTTTGCGGTSSLSANCTGSGCGGVSYSWSSNGEDNYNGSPVTVTLPNANGAVTYTLRATKAGCPARTDVTTVTVSGCNTGGGGTIDRTELGTAGDDGASNPGNEGESQAFDNSNFTKWLVFSPTGNIAYDFAGDDNYAISSYTVASANDSPDRDPKNWSLEGSDNGSTWTAVDTRNNESFADRLQTKPYTVLNPTAYKQYRLNVTANHGAELLQIAEIQMFSPAGGGGCTPPSSPSISANTTTAPAELTATGCGGTVTWSTGSTSNPLTNAGSGTYTATCKVDNCTSGPSNQVAIVGGGGSCPTYSNPQWFHWDNASGSLWFAHYGPTGLLYAATDANPATPPLTRQQLINSGVTPTLANCFLDGRKQRIASGLDETEQNLAVFPNPTNGKIKVSFTLQKDENVWFNLYDTQGKNLQLNDFEGKKGRNEVEFDLQNYTSGAYFIDLQYNQRREVRKVMKVN